MKNSSVTHFDLIISGAGTVGSCLALSLSKCGLKVAIVEANTFQKTLPHPGFDARAIALSKHSQLLLNQYGLDKALATISTPIRKIHVSDKGYLGQCLLDHQDYQLDALGYVVEMQDLGQCLHQALNQTQTHWFCPDTITDIETIEEFVKVQLSSGKTLSANLIVAADGDKSHTRELLKITQNEQDYQQVAIIANIATDKPHDNKAYERFTENGPVALLPMSSEGSVSRSSLVWTVRPESVQDLLAMPESEFLEQLQSVFGYRLGRFVKSGKRFSYPLKLSQVAEQIKHRAAIIGNASHTIHPIAGQGFNLGLRDVETLRECIVSSHKRNKDVGGFACLQAYRQQRVSDQAEVIGLTDGLVRVFSNDYLPLVIGRNMGLAAMNFFAPLKKKLADKAMGRAAVEVNNAKL